MRYFIKPSIFALTTIGASLAFSSNVQANVEHLPCPMGSTGPTSSGICNLGVLPDSISAYYSSAAQAVSADGTTVVGDAMNDGNTRAFRWRNDGAGLLDLGTLKADNSGESFATEVSADGSTIIGRAQADDNNFRAYRWVDDGSGMLDLGSLRTDNRGSSEAVDVSADGSIIVGSAKNDDDRDRAFRWINDGKGMLDLGTLKANNTGNSIANAVSSDGSTIVGRAQVDVGSHAFRWRDDGKGMLDLGTLKADGSGSSDAKDVSANGGVIVGHSDSDMGEERAFRWTDDGKGMLDLGTLRADGSGASWATGVSADGSTIIGRADTSIKAVRRAFRWTDDGVGMIDLGSFRTDNLGSSLANAISADGGTIVGQAQNNFNENRAFRWIDDGNGMLDLGTLRTDNSGYSNATGVSADGSVIVGNAVNDRGEYRAFIWRTKMQDFGNLLVSFPSLTNDSEIAVSQQQSVADQLMGSSCSAEEGQKCLSIDGVVTNAGATAEDIGSRNSTGGQVTLGYGVDGKTTVGGTLNISATSLSNSGFDLGANTAASVWAEYSATGLAGTGLQADAAFGKGRASGKVTRGRDLENVMLAAGNASLETFFAQVSLGYGVQIKDWLITPVGTLAYYDTSRSAYTETGSDFNAEYDRLSMKRTTATLNSSASAVFQNEALFSWGQALSMT